MVDVHNVIRCEVHVQTRRRFLSSVSASGLAVLGAQTGEPEKLAVDAGGRESEIVALCDGWEFQMDAEGSADPAKIAQRASGWQAVEVPHTWQSLGRSPEYVGVAWYRLRLDAPNKWAASRCVRIEFEAVNHTAHVFLNGKAVGEHVGRGYTAFTLDISDRLANGAENTLMVRVDNRPGDRMLPRNKCYDWTDDGGIIRPVNLLITARMFIERVEIDAVPDLVSGSAEIKMRAVVRNADLRAGKANVRAAIRQKASAEELLHLGPVGISVEGRGEQTVELGPMTLKGAQLWHFDSPHLYQALIELESSSGSHQVNEHFGIRRFEVRGRAFYLNGEQVSLIGVERMAGSHPEQGFAEMTQWIESNHRDMKELNCVFTRVHWAQDRRVLDFCDRHGILMQEEVPAWGQETFLKTTDDVQHALEQNGLEQLREMIRRDRNHPCIVAWGLCNEVDGKNPRSKQFARAMSAEARRLDPSRLQTYASHTLGSHPGADMAGEFDFISANEYYGSWTPGGPEDVEACIEGIRKAFPEKPIVISEYGWCECQPKIMPGDENRVAIVNSHTEVFRKFPEVAGAIYFDYNDYRTLVGDKGKGAMRQRVHGVVDLYGRRKPSFEALRMQASPLERAVLRKLDESRFEVELRARERLPGYVLRDYSLRWIAYGYDDLAMDGGKVSIPDLHPGSSQSFKIEVSSAGIRRIVVDIIRPTDFSAMTVEYLVEAAQR
ncbi:glycoside hydrolase family 2 protein [Occallatibacter savannae]|uniref:glycoside hydrolase family 2 protein n=1 Tax=Occallatibacter savannae TaxID=1002691 RepID=UPI000D694351|nr:glycoside hydrolase family 2 TIM barrel-domain containing protein [Occallatibacter savannae]